MRKIDHHRINATYFDAEALLALVGQTASNTLAETERQKWRQLNAHIFMLSGLIEASDALYCDGNHAKSLERFDSALPVTRNIRATARAMETSGTNEIVAIAEDLAHQLKLERHRVVNGKFYQNRDGERAPNFVDALINDLIDAVETTQVND